MSRFSRAAAAFVVSSVVLACSSSEEGPGVSVATEKTLASLTDTEASDTCFELADYVDTALDAQEKKKVGCLATAVLSSLGATDEASAKAACRTAVDRCMAEGGGFPVAFSGTCKTFRERSKSCQKTVGEYASCMEDRVAEYKKKLVDPCADVKLSSGDTPPDAPGRCAPFREACPTLLSNGPTP